MARISLNLNRSTRHMKHLLKFIFNSLVYAIFEKVKYFTAVIKNDLHINLLKHKFPTTRSKCGYFALLSWVHFKLMTFRETKLKPLNCFCNNVVNSYCEPILDIFSTMITYNLHTNKQTNLSTIFPPHFNCVATLGRKLLIY